LPYVILTLNLHHLRVTFFQPHCT